MQKTSEYVTKMCPQGQNCHFIENRKVILYKYFESRRNSLIKEPYATQDLDITLIQ